MRLCPLSTQVANDGTRFGCSAANSFRPLGMPRHRFDIKMSALADVWVRPSDEAIEFVASLARIDKLHPAARPLEQTSGDSFTYRGFRKRRCSQSLSCSTIRCGLLVFCPPQFLIFRWTSFFPLKGAFRANNRTLDEMVDRLAPTFRSAARRPGKNGGYPNFASDVSCVPGCRGDSVARHSSFKTWSRLGVGDRLRGSHLDQDQVSLSSQPPVFPGLLLQSVCFERSKRYWH
jgi:hypothetical protein